MFENLALSFINFGLSYLMAIMTPGPSMLIILRNTFSYSKKLGFITALGTVSGIALQALYTILGFSLLHESSLALAFLNASCAFFLLFTGIRILLSLKINNDFRTNCPQSLNKGNFSAFKDGFLIDVLNPLALSFFLASFSLLFSKEIEFNLKFIYWCEIVIIGSFWFMGLPLVLKNQYIKQLLINKLSKPLNMICAVLFMVFAVKLISSNLILTESVIQLFNLTFIDRIT